MNNVFLDRFDTVSHLRGKDRTYENVKAAVLKAGRYSCFDIETPKDIKIFTKLSHDPELEITLLPYPWHGVKKAEFCVWKQDDDHYTNTWYTTCEQIHIFFDDTPTANGYKFCPYCGKLLKEADNETL